MAIFSRNEGMQPYGKEAKHHDRSKLALPTNARRRNALAASSWSRVFFPELKPTSSDFHRLQLLLSIGHPGVVQEVI
jgi:hypothetical protein